MSRRTRGRIVGLVAAAALLFGADVRSGQPVVHAEELLARLETAIDLAVEGAEDPSPEQMAALRSALGLPLVVEVHGRGVHLPQDGLLDRLGGERAEDFVVARSHLERLRDGTLRALEAQPADPSAVRTALERAYRGLVVVNPGIVGQVWEILGELLQNLMSGLGGLTGPLPWVGWLSVLALGVIALWLLARARLVPERVVRATGRAGSATAADWRAAADEAIRRGDLREALGALYRALLATLAGRGIVTDAITVTAGECRMAVAAVRPAIYGVIEDATARFERVAYGGSRPDAADIEALRRAELLARNR